MGVSVLGVFLALSGLVTVQSVLNDVNRCLPGPFHKYYASPESPEFPECHAFAQNSCCQFHIADEIANHGASNLYGGYHWDRCGTLSERCRAFIADEECFYQCEPSLWHFQDKDYPDKGYVKNVPICASYCNAWFDACKFDKTCVVDWLNDFNYTESENHCPTDSQCKTFEEIYVTAEGLCNTMWGHAFRYEKDETACMLMDFDQTKCQNPNSCALNNVTCDKARYEGCGGSAITPLSLCVAYMVVVSYYLK